MHPLKRLHRLLMPTVPNSGIVVKAGPELQIATPAGLKLIQRSLGDATRYGVGDHVILINGQVAGRRNANPPVYVL